MYYYHAILILTMHLLFLQAKITTIIPCPGQLIPHSNSLHTQKTHDLTIIMIYNNSEIPSRVQNATIYNNSELYPQFMIPIGSYTCDNTFVFTINQTYQQFVNNTEYYLVLQNYQLPLKVNITPKYSHPIPTPTFKECLPPQCHIRMTNNCQQQNDRDYNAVTVSIMTQDGTLIIQFQYNFLCYAEQFYNYLPPRWGVLVIVTFSIILIFISSKFQQATSYSNVTLYINYFLIFLYCFISVLNFLLIFFSIPNYNQFVENFCLALSMASGILSIMICFSQFAFSFKKAKCFRIGYAKGRFRIRIMDIIGFILGVGLICTWYFTGKNWIASDVIFIFNFLSLIKLVKFGSLKIAFINFISSLVVVSSEIVIAVVFNKTAIFNAFTITSNPLFLMTPIISKIPNYSCAWYFILQMAYPGMFLAYLERFDKSRSSMVYATIFIICYSLCSIAWFVVNLLLPFQLPFELFTVPISMILLALFANRRGELEDIWTGRFFDEQKNYFQNEQQMVEHLKKEKSPSTVTYENQMFRALKYGQKSDDMSRSSRESHFSQVITAALNDQRPRNTDRLMYSQGKPKNLKPPDHSPIHQSLQTNLVSQSNNPQPVALSLNTNIISQYLDQNHTSIQIKQEFLPKQ